MEVYVAILHIAIYCNIAIPIWYCKVSDRLQYIAILLFNALPTGTGRCRK
jgi:hypothetical protein